MGKRPPGVKGGQPNSRPKEDKMFRGAFTALVTPFRNGSLDEESYRKHIDWQISEGINGVVPCGTTGESATLSHDEHRRVIEIAIDEAKGRVPVIAGAGSNSTSESMELAKFAKSAGADAALIITPYYNKPTPAGMVAHFKAVAEASKIPIIAYNVPGRTSVDMAPETVAELAAIPEVVGIKEATGSMEKAGWIKKLCPAGFLLLSGDDPTVLPQLALGGVGTISVVSNIAPADMAGMISAFGAGDIEKARELHFKMLPLIRTLFVETNPIPVKTALAMMGRMSDELRLPLCQLTDASRATLKGALSDYGLI
jgi:4-hydroxy-tetrahydrodipicolinate synthase